MRHSHVRILAPMLLVVLGTAIGVITYHRQNDDQSFRQVLGAARLYPHDGYDTIDGSCNQCHSIAAAIVTFPDTSLDTANLFCVTCHVPGVRRPDPAVVFAPLKVPGGAMQGSRAPHHFDVAGGQPPSSLRLVLNSLGSGISVYQEDPYNPSISGHRQMICLNCHMVHSNRGRHMRTRRGGVTGAKILKTKPSRKLSLGKKRAVTLLIDNWAAEGSAWCLRCHPKDASSNGHNHPDYLCLQCHQDTGLVTPLSVAQFPHTGATPSLLAADPDTLCVSCHTKGSMP